MIATDTPHNDHASHKTKSTRILSQPYFKMGVHSGVISPVPPIDKPSRHDTLSKRQRQNRTCKISRKSPIKHVKLENLKKDHESRFKSIGLEIKPENLIWRGWEPGEEYTKQLTIKNIGVETKKIKYRASMTSFFTTLYPHAIVISAGTSFSLPITFKPLEKKLYQDEIEFYMAQGSFVLHLRGVLPEARLHIPDNIHFGLFPVNEVAEQTFEIYNTSGELATDFALDGREPFSFSPRTGTLQPKSSTSIKATFHPTSATVYDATIVCSYGDNLQKTIQAEGIGKYPHLIVSDSSSTSKEANNTTILFGDVYIGDSSQKFVYLHNLSNVKAPFSIRRCQGTSWMDESFSVSVCRQFLHPSEVLQVPITYCPQIVGRTDLDYFEVCTHGSLSKSLFRCIGHCIGLKLGVSTSCLSFGLLEHPEKVSRRSFHLHNHSDYKVVFQFDLDQFEGVFRISESSGVLPPRESKHIIATFHPTVPMNYHRRVVIFVYEQGPLIMDMIGTLHDDETKPHPLKSYHLDRYNIHASRGLSFYPPDILKQQLNDGKISLDENECYKMLYDDHGEIVQRDSMVGYFDDGHHTKITTNPPHVSLNQVSIWFGKVELADENPRTVQSDLLMSNHTFGKVTARWIEDPTSPFKVTPLSYDLLPGKSFKFRVLFRPSKPNKFFGRKLECYVNYKINRDYQLIDEDYLIPPWLLTVDVCGHTFHGNNETFYPEVSVSHKKLVFPSALPGQSCYRTLLFENKGTTPFLYQFQKDEDEITVKSQFGFSRSKYTISALRFSPTSVRTYNKDLLLRLNDTPKHDKVIKLIGTGEQPELLLSDDGEMFFRPVCTNTSVSRDYEIRNAGRLSCYFRWVISGDDSKILSVHPKEGSIMANELQHHRWTFQPSLSKKFILKATCLVWPYDGSTEKEKLRSIDARQYKLRIVGEGCSGDIEVEKFNFDFGCVIVGMSKSEPLAVYNNSRCDIRIQLLIKQTIQSQYGEDANEFEPNSLKLSQSKITIPSRSKVILMSTAEPYRRVLYTWKLHYQLLDQQDNVIFANERLQLCELCAEGVYPMLSIIDARPSGSGTSISKTQLWRWFSIDNLNSCLDSDPEKEELRFLLASVQSIARRPSTFTKSILDFNFGAAGVGSESCYVSMMVENTGPVSTKWSFMFPKELELEIDYWAETGIFSAEELHELHVQDNELFTVHPSKGTLNPGERRTILFVYKHDIPGTHRVPVLLKVENGKEILLNFVGVTVEANRKYLHFPGTRHTFNPVPIGELTPPKQLYEMFNGGSMSVVYEVDQGPLVALQEENFLHPVLTCLNPSGEISPGMSSNLEFIFSPLENKTYSVDIPIHIVGGETALITFKGIGYDSRVLGKSMPKLDQPPEFISVPATQKVTVPGQMLFLSEERISLGNLPLFGKSRHVIFLTNKSDNRPLSYSWHATSPIVNEVLSLQPAQGFLQPGQSSMVRIQFCAAGQPSFYDLDLVCEVIDEVEVAEYHSESKAWQEERDRQADEFVITGNDRKDTPSRNTSSYEVYSGPAKYELSSPKLNIDNILNKSPTPVRLTESDFSRDQVKSDVKFYQTLPPIRFENPVKLPSNRSRLIRHQEEASRNEWVRPQYPKPFILHLGITARTHDIAQYRLHFSGPRDRSFIDRTSQIENFVTPKPADVPQYELTTCGEGEKDMVVSVMSDVIRSLLDDPTFHRSVAELANESTPYFAQLPLDKIKQNPETERTEGIEMEGKDITPNLEKSDNTISSDSNKKYDEKSPSLRIMSEVLEQTMPENISTDFDLPKKDNQVNDGKKAKRSSYFASLLEDLLSSAISNVMEEAMNGEVLLTVRPRAIALPPSRNQSISRRETNDSQLRKSLSNQENPTDKQSVS